MSEVRIPAGARGRTPATRPVQHLMVVVHLLKLLLLQLLLLQRVQLVVVHHVGPGGRYRRRPRVRPHHDVRGRGGAVRRVGQPRRLHRHRRRGLSRGRVLRVRSRHWAVGHVTAWPADGVLHGRRPGGGRVAGRGHPHRSRRRRDDLLLWSGVVLLLLRLLRPDLNVMGKQVWHGPRLRLLLWGNDSDLLLLQMLLLVGRRGMLLVYHNGVLRRRRLLLVVVGRVGERGGGRRGHGGRDLADCKRRAHLGEGGRVTLVRGRMKASHIR